MVSSKKKWIFEGQKNNEDEYRISQQITNQEKQCWYFNGTKAY
jgi:hypothetical protein